MTPDQGTAIAQDPSDGSMQGATDALIGLLERDDTLGAGDGEGEAQETPAPPVKTADPKPEKTPPEEVKEPPEGEGEEEAPEGTEEPAAAEGEQEPLYTVKVDGKEEKVTLDELQRGFSGQRWITQKSQALEAERKAIQQERETLTKVIPQLLERLKEPEPDWEKLRAEDEFKFVVERQAWQVRQEQRNALVAAQQATQAKLKETEDSNLAAKVAEEKNKLLAAIPAWRDEARAKAGAAEIRAYAKEIGFTDEELDASYDARVVLALNDAMQFRKLAKAQPPRPVTNRGPRSASPGAGQSTPGRSADYSRMKARVKETGSVDDAAAIFENADL